jgi:hypothetical protein
MWMHVPQALMPNKAFSMTNSALRNDARIATSIKLSSNVLRHNTNHTVSTLDIIPTLRDLLNYSTIYSEDQKQKCVTGVSLMSQWIPKGRVVVGWGGTPLDGINVGTFSNESHSLFYSPRDTSQSRLVELKFVEENTFFSLFETPFKDVKQMELVQWRKILERQSWLNHSLIKIRMPLLSNALT